MSEVATGQVPASGAVQADPDAAKYAELAKELGQPEPSGRAAEPEPRPEPSPEPAPEQRAKPEHVPYAEHENVQKALREARDSERRHREQLEGVMRLAQESIARRQRDEAAPKKDEPPKLPDVSEDPIGFFTGRIAQLEEKLQQAHRGVEQTSQEQQAYQQHQAMWQQVARSEQDIRDTKNPQHKADYDDACLHLEGQRIKQLNRLYPDESPYAVQFAQQQGFRSAQDLKLAILNQDRQTIAIQALQLGQSPAETYYNLALDSGYTPKPNGQQRGANGQFESLADKAKAQLETTKKGKAAAISISGSNSGRKGADDLSISDLSDLFIEDPEAADKIWEQMRRAGRLG